MTPNSAQLSGARCDRSVLAARNALIRSKRAGAQGDSLREVLMSAVRGQGWLVAGRCDQFQVLGALERLTETGPGVGYRRGRQALRPFMPSVIHIVGRRHSLHQLRRVGVKHRL
jgi:hypothetical protein